MHSTNTRLIVQRRSTTLEQRDTFRLPASRNEFTPHSAAAGIRPRSATRSTAQVDALAASQNAGSTTRARYPGGNSPFPRKWTNGMSFPGSARIRTPKGIQLPRMANRHSDEVAGGAVRALTHQKTLRASHPG